MLAKEGDISWCKMITLTDPDQINLLFGGNNRDLKNAVRSEPSFRPLDTQEVSFILNSGSK